MDERVLQATGLVERAIFTGVGAGAGSPAAAGLAEASHHLDAAEADLALARAKVLHAGFLTSGDADPAELSLLERAAVLYRGLGSLPGEAEALCWAGIYHQVVGRDQAAAVPLLDRSRELAARAGDTLTLSYALRHIGVAHHAAGRLADARAALEESTRLRRELGFLPGVAANLVGLAHVALGEGRRPDAVALAEEAHSIAEMAGATTVSRLADEARRAAG